MLVLFMYQVFIFLLGFLHFFMHFFFTFKGNLFMDHPIRNLPTFSRKEISFLSYFLVTLQFCWVSRENDARAHFSK